MAHVCARVACVWRVLLFVSCLLWCRNGVECTQGATDGMFPITVSSDPIAKQRSMEIQRRGLRSSFDAQPKTIMDDISVTIMIAHEHTLSLKLLQ